MRALQGAVCIVMLKVRCADSHKLSCLEENKNKRAASVALLDTLCWSQIKATRSGFEADTGTCSVVSETFVSEEGFCTCELAHSKSSLHHCLGMLLSPLDYWDL